MLLDIMSYMLGTKSGGRIAPAYSFDIDTAVADTTEAKAAIVDEFTDAQSGHCYAFVLSGNESTDTNKGTTILACGTTRFYTTAAGGTSTEDASEKYDVSSGTHVDVFDVTSS